MTQDKQNSPEETPAASQGSTGAGTLGKFGTVAVGLILLLFGLSMVIPQGETGMSGMERALGALVTALGGGIIATVLLPHAIEVEGKQVKPFGVDLKASGGVRAVIAVRLFWCASVWRCAQSRPDAGAYSIARSRSYKHRSG